MKAKQIQQRLLTKENELVREVKLYCAGHDIEFTKEHNKLLRTAMRNFFQYGVYPLIRDLNQVNIRSYHNENE